MRRQEIMQLIIGTMVLLSAALTYWQSKWWLLLTAFIGLNLFQSGLTRWCLLRNILGWLSLGEE